MLIQSAAQVLDRLPALVKPAPIPLISDQYAKTIKKNAAIANDHDNVNDADDDAEASDAAESAAASSDHEDEGKPQVCPVKSYRFQVTRVKAATWKKPTAKPKSKNRKPAEPKPPKGPEAEAEADTAQAFGDYVPKDFHKRSLIFREAAKAAGHAPRAARQLWMDSDERAALLAEVPLQELKRRKFVPKECTENPFIRAGALGGC